MKSVKMRSLFANLTVIVISVFFIAIVVYGATTIGDNINTGGDLTVLGHASTTNATTTGYLYVGTDITEPAGWDFGIGDLIVTDDTFMNSQATTSASLWVGSGGTANNINLAGGDLYVQNDAEIDGTVYLSNVSGNTTITGRATTTENFVAGSTNTAATTTVTLGSSSGEVGAGLCLKIRRNEGWTYCYVVGTAFVCGATSCE